MLISPLLLAFLCLVSVVIADPTYTHTSQDLVSSDILQERLDTMATELKGDNVKKDTHFDLLILTKHWPYTTCIDWKKHNPHNACRNITSADWFVHGLWPTQLGKVAPGYCNDSWSFDADRLTPIRPALEKYWPDIEVRPGQPYSLWSHEWEKHGTCAAQLVSMDSELKYFSEGIHLASLHPISDWLEAASIIPIGADNNVRYTKSDFYTSILKHTGKRPHIDCEWMHGQQLIKEIKVCFDKNLTLVHCDNIVGASHHRHHNHHKHRTHHHNSKHDIAVLGGSCKDDVDIVYPGPGYHLPASTADSNFAEELDFNWRSQAPPSETRSHCSLVQTINNVTVRVLALLALCLVLLWLSTVSCSAWLNRQNKRDNDSCNSSCSSKLHQLWKKLWKKLVLERWNLVDNRRNSPLIGVANAGPTLTDC